MVVDDVEKGSVDVKGIVGSSVDIEVANDNIDEGKEEFENRGNPDEEFENGPHSEETILSFSTCCNNIVTAVAAGHAARTLPCTL